MKKVILSILCFSALIFMGCSNEETESIPEAKVDNTELLQLFADISNGSTAAGKSDNNKSDKSERARPPVWADCIEYVAIVTPATFKPESGNFDELYMMPEAMFYNGLPLISDSKPGDQDYNGGRWHMNVLKAGVDASKYNMACKEEDLDLEDFTSTDIYFSCPVLPKN